MKFNKILTMALMLAVASTAFAGEKATPEEIANRDYSSWLPAAGDFSIGFTLDPIATFVGNLFNGNLNNSLDPLHGDVLLKPELGVGDGLHRNVSVMGKYMLTDQLGIRANIGFGTKITKQAAYVDDESILVLDEWQRAQVIDTYKGNQFSGSFAVGAEYRVGKRMVQGVFAFSALYGCEVSTEKVWTYGNAITEINQTPANAGLGVAPGVMTAFPGVSNARPLSQKASVDHYIGGVGSIGVEVFVAPKISLGADVNLTIYGRVGGPQSATFEGWNEATNEVSVFNDVRLPKTWDFVFSTNNIGANLSLNFYF